MPHKEIRKTLDELKGELQQTPKETGRFEETLDHAKESIEKYTPEAVQDLIETLQNEAREFEAEHPRIITLVNNITTSLSNLGI